MLYPEINKLRDEAGSRYFLVSMASKRARDIISGSPKLDSTIKTNKPVSIAAEEIGKSLFTYKTIQQIEEEKAAAENALAEAEAYARENSMKEAEEGVSEENEAVSEGIRDSIEEALAEDAEA